MKSPKYALSLFFVFGLQVAKADTIHKVTYEETAWFISQLYYGDGSKFTEILQANGLESADQIKSGMDLVIPLPKYPATAVDFKNRYAELKAERSKKLAAKKMGKLDAATQMVVVPPVEIQSQVGTGDLPVTEVKGALSPAEKARAELRKAAAE